jgi:hypothetical protein
VGKGYFVGFSVCFGAGLVRRISVTVLGLVRYAAAAY